MKGKWIMGIIGNKQGMEMVQVAILVAIAVTLGLIFKEQITDFVNNTFGNLAKTKFWRIISNKEGSIFIEASIVMPIACIIAILLIEIAVVFFNDFNAQVEEHKRELDEKNYYIQIEIIRNYENIF